MLVTVLLACAAGLAGSVPLLDEITPRRGEACGYESCTAADPGMLNVHLVPHTHDDVGWLKTLDQYYYGSRNNIQKAGVQYILDSVIKELWEDSKRRFIYVETAFFWKWWVLQPDSIRHKVHTLVRQGRLQFVGGAWSMNDEAASHYQSTVDQFTWGLSKLNQTFGACGVPRVGWQIDPFGHSREFASLLAAMGYDGLFLGRIDYQDKNTRKQAKSMEMLWRGDDDLGKPSDIFTGVLYNTYSPPPGFCFDVLCNDEPIVDDLDSPMYNVDERVKTFFSFIAQQVKSYKTQNIFLTMGGDFTYQDAAMWYKNLDKLIENMAETPSSSGRPLIMGLAVDITPQGSINVLPDRVVLERTGSGRLRHWQPEQGQNMSMIETHLQPRQLFPEEDIENWNKEITLNSEANRYANLLAAKNKIPIKLFYSTPDCYLKAVHDLQPKLPVKQDDFFPYASDENSYWTGYFSSRPTTKYFEREGNNYLQMVKQLQVLAGLEDHNRFVLNELKSAMGVMQHHDAITGTEKQHVTHDYERILNDAVEDALTVARQAFNKAMQGDALKPPLFSYDRCRLNESACETSENSRQFVVTVYNHLAWHVNESVRIPVVEGSYAVYAPNGEQIVSQIVDIPSSVLNIPTRKSKATHEIVFIAYLKPVSFKSYYIKTVDRTKRETNIKTEDERKIDYYTNINDFWKKIKDQPNVDIQNIEEEEFKNLNLNLNVNQDTDEPEVVVVNRRIPDEPLDKGSGNAGRSENYVNSAKNFDLGLLIILNGESEAKRQDVQELEKMIREARVSNGPGKTVRGRAPGEKSRSYPGLGGEELRMLADEPRIVERHSDEEYLENEHIKVRVDKSTGEITHAILPDGGELKLNIQYFFYPGCIGNNEVANNRSSGAYIFRPNATSPYELTSNYTQGPVGPVVKEFRFTMSNNVATTVRLYDGLNFIENEWVVGPIDIEDDIGKEFIVRYVTDIVNNGEFYTDSNGRQMLKRKLNQRPQYNVTLSEPIAGNYYPITNKIYIEDGNNRIAVLTDRSEGGSSLLEGQIELMLHRRLLHDDAFGVGEALNETANGLGLVVRGRHRIYISKSSSKDDNVKEKKLVLQNHLQPQVFVSDAANVSLDQWMNLTKAHSWANDLPDGVHLLTLEPWYGTTLLLRLENYLETSDRVDATVEVDLTKIFNGLKFKSFKETKLAANQWVSGEEEWVWNKERGFVASFNKDYGSFERSEAARDVPDTSDNGFKIKLKARQIRTFVVDYEFKSL